MAPGFNIMDYKMLYNFLFEEKSHKGAKAQSTQREYLN